VSVTQATAAPTARGAISARLERELADHREALLAFVATAEGLSSEAWGAARAADKWSPAQITEHLRLTYVAVRAELAGQGGMRVRTKWWQQRLFRFIFLPRILKQGRFPKGVRAMREIRPAGGPFDRAEVLVGLQREGEGFIAAVRTSTGKERVTHPYLGPLGVDEGVRFLTQHLRHHHAQVGA
jgi:hypothetical protein